MSQGRLAQLEERAMEDLMVSSRQDATGGGTQVYGNLAMTVFAAESDVKVGSGATVGEVRKSHPPKVGALLCAAGLCVGWCVAVCACDDVTSACAHACETVCPRAYALVRTCGRVCAQACTHVLHVCACVSV